VIRRLVITPAADQDLEEIATYIGHDNPAAATRFVSAATAAFHELVEMTYVGSRVLVNDPRLTDLRRRRVPRFGNYLIFYRVTEEAVQIVRVLHGARDIERILDLDD